MKAPTPPRLDRRRAGDFERELIERARVWVPEWGSEDDGDFGHALLTIAARFSAEVAQRLDGAGDKMRRGFFDWLGTPRAAARPARVPVVVAMGAKAQSVLAEAPLRMSADVPGASVVFETETDVRLLPGRLATVVAADADADAFYVQPPGLTDIAPQDAAPDQWQLKSFAAPASTTLQVDPDTGLAPDMIVAIAGTEYRVTAVNKDLVTIDPPVPAGAGFGLGTIVRKVSVFEPFETGALDRQSHALYLGHPDVLNIEAPATIEVVGAQALAEAGWHYWGKKEGAEDVGWQQLDLAPTQPGDGVALVKGKGSIEARAVGPVKSARWLRASTNKVPGSAPLLSVESLALRVNYQPLPSCPATAVAASASPNAEALTNTTPLVLNTTFFPLGRTPKQFDTFYLGYDEAFSKKGAIAQLCFTLADASFISLSAIRGGHYADTMIVGVGRDQALHLYGFDGKTGAITPFRGSDPLRPPSPQVGGGAVASPLVPLDQFAWRLPTWSEGNDFLVAVTAGSQIWEWHEVANDPTKSGWRSLGELASSTSPPGPVDGLVYLDGALPLLVALQDGTLFLRSLNEGSPWAPATPVVGGQSLFLESIVPVLAPSAGQLSTSTKDGLAGIASDGTLYTISTDNVSWDAQRKTLVFPTVGPRVGKCTAVSVPKIKTWATEVRPVVMKKGTGHVAVAVRPGLQELGAADTVTQSLASESLLGSNATVVLNPTAPPRGGSLEPALDGNELAAIVSVQSAGGAYLASWTPFAGAPKGSLYTTELPNFVDPGAAMVVAKNVVVPGQRGGAAVAKFDLANRLALTGAFDGGIVVPASAPALVDGDVVTLMVGNVRVTRKISTRHVPHSDDVFHSLDQAFPQGKVGAGGLLAYLVASTAGAAGNATSVSTMELASGDHGVERQSTLFIDLGGTAAEYAVTDVDKQQDPWVVTLKSNLPGNSGATKYWSAIATDGRAAPTVTFNPSDPTQVCKADAVARAGLIIAAADHAQQTAEPFDRDANGNALFVVLGEHWLVAPAAKDDLVLDDAVVGWSRQLGDVVANPELSWEYWNGSWSTLVLQHEDTLNLRRTGSVTFEVPDDVAPTDWAGKTHFWVRARLVGGDYGTETVEVITEDLGNNTTKQSFKRATEGFTAPLVMNLAIVYQLATDVLPTYVLAEDSGTTRDQSDANATAGALVEAFVPLSVSLGRLLAGGAATTAPGETCPADCDCSSQTASTGGTGGAANLSQSLPVTPAIGRSLLLGFDAPLAGDTVKVLLTIAHAESREADASLAVGALVGRRFVPVRVQDDTRALGESGVLTLAFPDPPTEATLFGSDALRWIRLVPTGFANDQWSPSLRGAYLNAVWASATETLTHELLGSSEGEPNLTVTLARPPVLSGSLELRVREPLNDEERAALLNADPDCVLADPNLSGDWVLWDQVADPADEDPKRRAYALDEASGAIRFGDGVHGKIPPVGRDAIVAFRYQRTEPAAPGAVDVPANAVAARAALNLVTPVAGAEAVFAADQAAGGAPAESDERVLRFGMAKLRHRGRALTPQDLEDIALESSPDIVQARAVVRGGRTRLVVVMRGDDPAPSVAQMRELKRLLLVAAPPSFDPTMLDVVAPRLRLLRVALGLRVETLDHAAGVNAEVACRLAALLDPATGGVSQEGWPLGASPRADEIAFALVDVPRLLGVATIDLAEVLADATAPWPAQLAARELARLAANGIHVVFEQIERAA